MSYVYITNVRVNKSCRICFATFAFCMVLCCQPIKQLFLHICWNANCVAHIWKNKSSRSREPAIENETRALCWSCRSHATKEAMSSAFRILSCAHAKRNPHSHEAAAKWNRTRSNLKLVCQVVATPSKNDFPLAWVSTRVWFPQHQHVQQSSPQKSLW